VPQTAEGRWSALEMRRPSRAASTQWSAAAAQQLLTRHGVITRETVASESMPGGFAVTYHVLRAMDDAGRVRRGEERPAVIRFAADSTATLAEQNAPCLGCHDGDAGFGWHGGPHEANQIACADCHTIHASRDAVLGTATQADVCYDCHATVRTEAFRPYSHPLRVGKMSCTSCHSPHGATLELQLVRETVNQTCYQCHADKRGPFLWEHAPVAEDCALCHASHGSIHPSLLAQRAPLLCQSCHSQAGHPSIPQTPDGLAAAAPSAFLLGQSCMNCHSQVHGSNHPSGAKLMR